MHGAHEFLRSLAIVLCVAAVTTVLFQRLRQPVVLGYLIAGLIIGPHVPIPLVADLDTTQALAELGVILLMFSLGLEFSLRRLARVGAVAGIIAVVQVSVMLWLGVLTARAFGWTSAESLYTGALIAISSTTIIAKAFEEQRTEAGLRELVFGVLIVEDLIAVLLLTTLTAVASGRGLSGAVLLKTTGKLAAVLVALVAGGMLLVPRFVRAVVRLGRPETTLIASIGICFATALLVQAAGYSVALGAFLAGSLVAESGEVKAIEPLVQPVRDVFAAVFFVAVGMMIDPKLAAQHWGAIVALTAVVAVGKVVGVGLGAFLTGHGVRTSLQAGMSLAQIGEFSFIIAGLGTSLGATRAFLYPVAVAVSALTTLLTPWLIRAAGPVASFVDRSLPAPLQTLATLYGDWVARLRAATPASAAVAERRRLVRLLLLDASALAAVVIGASRLLHPLALKLARRANVSTRYEPALVAALATAVALPLCVGVVRLARQLGARLAEAALPSPPGGELDLAAAPRRALAVTLQLACVLLVGAPLLAVTEPFVPLAWSAAVTVVVLVVLGVAFWRSATNLEEHVRAGVQVIVQALAAQSLAPEAHPAPDALADLERVLPGLGRPEVVALEAASPAVGRTLAELNLRGLSGATVLAIRRGAESHAPTAQERLSAGDELVLTGAEEALAAAREMLRGTETSRQA